MKIWILALAALIGGCASSRGLAPRDPSRPALIIAHRGASGERPEHTLAAYRLAIRQGADFIEPDLVMTRDGVLVARHENEISETTDVAAHPEFAGRKASKIVDGQSVTGWFTEDFTLSELKTLRAIERLPRLRPGNTAYDGQEAIPTFAEVLALAKAGKVGIYPETKHPSYFAALGLDMEKPLLAALAKAGLKRAKDRVFIQSFEVGNLRALARRTRLPLIQLIAADAGPADVAGLRPETMLSQEGLGLIAQYAAGIGVQKSLLLPRDSAGASLAPTDLVARAHALGLEVHAWTFRAENAFLPLELRRGTDASAPDYLAGHGAMDQEIQQALALGLDGLFTDFPAAGLAARDARHQQPARPRSSAPAR